MGCLCVGVTTYVVFISRCLRAHMRFAVVMGSVFHVFLHTLNAAQSQDCMVTVCGCVCVWLHKHVSMQIADTHMCRKSKESVGMLAAEVICFACKRIDFVFTTRFVVYACLHIFAHTCVLLVMLLGAGNRFDDTHLLCLVQVVS